MRIIAGEARGRRLFAPPGADTRPTADRVRESVFNILGTALRGQCVLDLFGGTGAMALEALSRGASRATIVDCSEQAMKVIRRNAQSVLGAEGIDRVELLRLDYRSAIPRLKIASYMYIFLDPPYRMIDAYDDALRLLEEHKKLAGGWTAILERDARQTISLSGCYECFDERKYGKAVIEFVRRKTD